jgi:hypothetical protein
VSTGRASAIEHGLCRRAHATTRGGEQRSGDVFGTGRVAIEHGADTIEVALDGRLCDIA